jgi:soluble lytic murein transglycosylase-like protein
MAALTFGNIAAGTEGFYAGMDLATKRRQTLRTEEKDVMALEALRRQEALRQQQANAPAPEAVTTGDLLGVGQQKPMDVEQVAPPAAPAPAATAPDQFSGAVSPETRQAVTQAPANIPYGQMVPNPSADPLAFKRATEMAQLNKMQVDNLNKTLQRTDLPPNARRNLEQQRDMYQKRLDSNNQVITRNQPTIDFGREGRSSVIRESTPQAVARSAVQYDAINTPYDDVMTKAAQQYGIDPVVFKRLIGTESSFKADAINNVNGKPVAFGIAQIYTTNIGTKQGQISQADAMDPLKAIPYAAQLFAQYLKEANGNYEQALYRYKGATSVAGRTAMARPIATILSGIDQPGVAPVQVAAAPGTPTAGVTPPVVGAAPAAPAAPGAAPAQPVVAGPIASAATPGVKQTKEPKSPTSYYLANTDAITGDQRILNEQYQRSRADGIRKFQMYQNAGMGAEAELVRDQITQLDNSYRDGNRLLQAMGTVYQLEYSNDPRGVSAAMSFYVGQPVAFQPRSDGNFNMWVNGQKVGEPMTRAQIRDAAREMFDTKYREAKIASQTELGMFAAKEGVKGQVTAATKRDEIQANMVKDVMVETTKGNFRLREESMKQGWTAKPDTATGTWVIIPPAYLGIPPYIYNPTGTKTVVDGVEIQSNAAVPIAGLPSATQMARGR